MAKLHGYEYSLIKRSRCHPHIILYIFKVCNGLSSNAIKFSCLTIKEYLHMSILILKNHAFENALIFCKHLKYL